MAVASEDEQGRKESEINFIECQINEHFLLCQPQDITKQIDSQKLEKWLDSLPEKETPPSVVKIDNGQESTYYALESKLEPGAAVQAVLDSSITGCEIAQLSIADQTGNTQYTLISPTIIDNTVEHLFNGELLQGEDISYLQTIYLCDNCSEIFQTSQACSRHITQCRKRKSAEPDDEQPHKKKPNQKKAYCDQCNKLLASTKHLKMHIKDIHEPKKYACTVDGCGKLYTTANKLERHIASFHKGERYACTVAGCTRLYTSLGNLDRHKKSVHGKEWYACPFDGCEKLFTQDAHRKEHVEVFHKGKRYHCTVAGCKKSYASCSNLRKHLHVHEGIGYECTEPRCKELFTSMSNLKRHQNKKGHQGCKKIYHKGNPLPQRSVGKVGKVGKKATKRPVPKRIAIGKKSAKKK
ncbi:C2H2-type zinc finger protein [Candidatus Sororendozoicomonas aggregata]|uniref:C2H2-type zinc finger protein n=1 Tax=Candidatus Sororendozoicomonas aggregata TaxID=3073239 RepID=UPI002ED0EAEE